MTFRPNMTAVIEGVSARSPLQWRELDGVVADLWNAEMRAGGHGYYISPNPRIVIFLDDMAEAISLASCPTQLGPGGRAEGGPARALYVPAGVPLWSRMNADRCFRHIDLHFDSRVLERYLTRASAAAPAADSLRNLAMIEGSPQMDAVADLLAAEIARPTQHDLFADGLVQGLVAGLLARRDTGGAAALTPAQIGRLDRHMMLNLDRKVATAELAGVVGLSESWFAHAFKQSTGDTPLQWQLRLRIDEAKRLLADPAQSLADVASATGFADQPHLTRAFRARTGQTPGLWRRRQGAG